MIKIQQRGGDYIKMKSGLRRSLLRVTVIPVVLFGVIITLYCSRQVSGSIHQEVESGLKNVAQLALYIYEKEFPGDYRMDPETSEIYKGDKKINDAAEILESYKKVTGADITIFYKDMRVLTTICDGEGNPIVGTKADPVTKREVLDEEKECFYTETKISNEDYFSYYCPIYDSQGECIGMVFAGKPSQYVSKIVIQSIIPIISIVAIVVVVIVFIMWRYSAHLTRAMQQLQNFIVKVEGGNFKTELGRKVAERNDELGMIGRSAVQMQAALRELVERDSLTGLYNRHYGEYWLREMKKEAGRTGISFYVAIADIDHFKNFNDQYGHDCGDMVLKQVSKVLDETMRPGGYAARWGGEEFLLIFSEKGEEQAIDRVNGIVEKIRSLKMRYGEQELSITVTIGFVSGDAKKHEDELIKMADKALYEGKENGRDQVRAFEV